MARFLVFYLTECYLASFANRRMRPYATGKLSTAYPYFYPPCPFWPSFPYRRPGYVHDDAPGGSQARREALAELSVLQHQILTDKRVGDWLAEADLESLDDLQRANLREMRRHYQQVAILPAALVEAKSLAGSRYEHVWRSQPGQRTTDRDSPPIYRRWCA